MFADLTLVVRADGAEFWRLVEPKVYQGARETWRVPSGFRTDFASVPHIFTWLIPRYGTYTLAAILHDYLCRRDDISRRDADGVFRRVLGELGVSTPRRYLMWAAVRATSGMSDATWRDWVALLLTAVPAVPLLLPPVAAVALWSAVFRQLERAWP